MNEPLYTLPGLCSHLLVFLTDFSHTVTEVCFSVISATWEFWLSPSFSATAALNSMVEQQDIDVGNKLLMPLAQAWVKSPAV